MTRVGGERGGAAVEIVIIAPLLIAMMLFIVGLGRLATSRAAVDGAARDGARQASMARSTRAAPREAETIVRAALAKKNVSCSDMRVNTDTADFRPGGTVTVRVLCTVANGDVVLSGLPGSSTLRGDFVAVVDQYRGVHADGS
jgi:Flp pilus assembly protein TadG